MAQVETPQIINGTHGQTICVPATWIDVAKFIGLNYVTHAFTIVFLPGASLSETIIMALCSLFMPIFGTMTALDSMTNFFKTLKLRRQDDRLRRFNPLIVAAHAGALRIIIGFDKSGIAQVPTAFMGMRLVEFGLSDMDSDMGTVHGQLPILQKDFWNPDADEESAQEDLLYYCFSLPDNWIRNVRPMNEEIGSFELAKEHNVVRAFAALFQIFFASKELYDARGRQIERYGYGAFGLTVFPYLWMSFLNLLANICEPQYSHKYIVYYRGPPTGIRDPNGDGQNDPMITAGDEQTSEDRDFEAKIVGAVGVVHGEPNDFFTHQKKWKDLLPGAHAQHRLLGWVIGCISLFVPYIAIYAMTSFQKARSTATQRLAVVGWLAAGQISALGLGLVLIIDGLKTGLYLSDCSRGCGPLVGCHSFPDDSGKWCLRPFVRK